jgi:hypothetical protein
VEGGRREREKEKKYCREAEKERGRENSFNAKLQRGKAAKESFQRF